MVKHKRSAYSNTEESATDITKYEVPADKLCWQCDPANFNFERTKDLAPLREFIGQNRAMRAIEFGLSMNLTGYNIYVVGLTGTGKTSVLKRFSTTSRRGGKGNKNLAAIMS